MQTLEDQMRGTLDAMRYAASLGVTTHFDQGGFPATSTAADGAAHFDRYRAYDALLALHAEGALINRIRLNFLHMETDPETPELQARLLNVFPDFGGPMLRVVGIGEFTAGASPIIGEASEEWLAGTRRVAEAGWRNENHSLTPADFPVIIDSWQSIHESLPAPGISDPALGGRARAFHHARIRGKARGARAAGSACSAAGATSAAALRPTALRSACSSTAASRSA